VGGVTNASITGNIIPHLDWAANSFFDGLYSGAMAQRRALWEMQGNAFVVSRLELCWTHYDVICFWPRATQSRYHTEGRQDAFSTLTRTDARTDANLVHDM
jgi:hypothetical protein